MQKLVAHIQQAQSLLLTTHKQCDGDGLGAALACYHALQQLGKKVKLLTIDGVPSKYNFLNTQQYVQNYSPQHPPQTDADTQNHKPQNLPPTDLALIFDTNDKRLIEPLYSELQKKCKKILFIDHHLPLDQGPQPTPDSYINSQAASTGEIVFELLQHLNIKLNTPIAQALYTSIAFDTQVFRYIKNSPKSLQLGAQLMQHIKEPESIHRALFATYTPNSLSYLGQILHQVEYLNQNHISFAGLHLKDLNAYKLKAEDVKDIIDMMSLVKDVKCAVTLREEAPNTWKLSLRTRGISALNIAQHFNGGGHQHAAGAQLKGTFKDLKKQIITQVRSHI